MKFTRIALALAASAAIASSASAATNLLKNGSFETGDFTDWSLNGATGDNNPAVVIAYGNTNNYPTGAYGENIPTDPLTAGSPDAGGSYGAYFVSDKSSQTLSQSVTLAAGSYEFGFDYYLPYNGARNANDATFAFSLNNVALATFQASQQPAGQWLSYSTTQTFNVTTPGTFTFSFLTNTAPAKDFVVDRVFLAAVPEPTSWAMMVGGFGLLGGALRRKRTTIVSFG